VADSHKRGRVFLGSWGGPQRLGQLAPWGRSARYAISSRVGTRFGGRFVPSIRNGPRTEIESDSRLVGVEPPLERGRLPLQRLFALFEVRNALVHPRRSGTSISAYSHNVTEQDQELIGPKAAASYIVAVAEEQQNVDGHRPSCTVCLYGLR
jgi:hypothetical protein